MVKQVDMTMIDFDTQDRWLMVYGEFHEFIKNSYVNLGSLSYDCFLTSRAASFFWQANVETR